MRSNCCVSSYTFNKNKYNFSFWVYSFSIYVLIYVGYAKVLFNSANLIFSVAQLFFALLAVVLFLCQSKKIFFSKFAFKPIYCFLLVFLVLIVQFFQSNNRELATERIISILTTVVFMCFLWLFSGFFDNNKKIINFLFVIVICNILILMFYFVVNSNLLISSFKSGIRGGSDESNPIWISRICCDTILLLMVCFKRRIIFRLCLIALLLGIVLLMGSKGPLVGVIIAISLFYIHSKHKIKVLAFWLFAALFIVILFLSNNPYIHSRFSIESIMVDAPGYRVDMYRYTIINSFDRFFLGHGLGSWPLNYWSRTESTPLWADLTIQSSDYPHNFIFEIFYDGGAAALLFLILAFAYLLKIRKKIICSNGLMIIWYLLLANIIYGMFSGSFVDGNRGIYYFLSLFCGMFAANKDCERIIKYGHRN